MNATRWAMGVLVATVGLGWAAGLAQAQKYGGTLKALLSDNPPTFSIHETSTYVTMFPMLPMYNNVVGYDSQQPQESLTTLVPQLAESWRWANGDRELVLKLRSGVMFHDGKPFTARDVKYTFDIVRGKGGKQRLRLNPRRQWYFNVEEIVTSGDHEVTIRLKRPQPSLLAMLATGYGAVYPEAMPPDEWRSKAIGTGPFALKEYQRDRYVLVERNPGYWVKGRPYLDAVRYNIIPARAARIAAYKTRDIEIDSPSDTTRPVMESLKPAVPELVFIETPKFTFQNVVINTTKPPFNEPRLRQVVNLALDRKAFAKSVFQGGMIPGGIMLPPPAGVWGLPADRLGTLPGYGDIEKNRAAARAIMAALGYSAERPLKTKLTTRTLANQVDSAIWTVSELKHVWINAEVQQLEAGQFYATLARRDFAFEIHGSTSSADDPDANLYENYGCNSQRNYSDYCVGEVQRLYDAQSETTDLARRLQIVHRIEARMIADVPRVIFGFLIRYNPRQPYVKNYVPTQTGYTFYRMQDVWLDR
ncbi:MAG: ABC transporter substrate-binding protein [Candidatus Lambdaproteobacteria bacterium]|nr:ABC transporter substrate-binding protein [Candidatus Lambdaproteobacteria bacterium]